MEKKTVRNVTRVGRAVTLCVGLAVVQALVWGRQPPP